MTVSLERHTPDLGTGEVSGPTPKLRTFMLILAPVLIELRVPSVYSIQGTSPTLGLFSKARIYLGCIS